MLRQTYAYTGASAPTRGLCPVTANTWHTWQIGRKSLCDWILMVPSVEAGTPGKHSASRARWSRDWTGAKDCVGEADRMGMIGREVD
jgi:hypothetical protein